jgi:hypothetical protein
MTALYEGKEFQRAADGIAALDHYLRQVGETRLPGIVRRELDLYLRKVATIVATRAGRPWPQGGPPWFTHPTDLSTRSGRAVESIHESVRVTGADSIGSIRGYIGGVGYLIPHEFGATIVPRRAKWLTLPLRPALGPNGVPLQRRARDWADTFIRRSRFGQQRLIIYQRRGSTIVPLYLLAKKVVIKPRLHMSLTLDQYIYSFIEGVTRSARRELTQGDT